MSVLIANSKKRSLTLDNTFKCDCANFLNDNNDNNLSWKFPKFFYEAGNSKNNATKYNYHGNSLNSIV